MEESLEKLSASDSVMMTSVSDEDWSHSSDFVSSIYHLRVERVASSERGYKASMKIGNKHPVVS